MENWNNGIMGFGIHLLTSAFQYSTIPLFLNHISLGAWMMKEFARLNRLPPYTFAVVNEIKMEARRAGEDIIDLGMGMNTFDLRLLKIICESTRRFVVFERSWDNHCSGFRVLSSARGELGRAGFRVLNFKCQLRSGFHERD